MEGHTPLLFKQSQIEMKHNYASLEIKRRGNYSIDITLDIRTINNVPILSRRFYMGE